MSTLKPSSASITLRLPVSLLERIKFAAIKQDMPYQSLINVWLAEKLTPGHKLRKPNCVPGRFRGLRSQAEFTQSGFQFPVTYPGRGRVQQVPVSSVLPCCHPNCRCGSVSLASSISSRAGEKTCAAPELRRQSQSGCIES